MKRFSRHGRVCLAGARAALLAGADATAGTVTGGSPLGGVSADRLELWPGVSHKNVTHTSKGMAGSSGAARFSAVADGVRATATIHGMLAVDGSRALVGGRLPANRGQGNGSVRADAALIFNLTTGGKQGLQSGS